MSRVTRQRDAVAPSLFPFLAVLLCTMGALVLILMLIVSGAQASALHIAEESEKQTEEVESQLKLASQGFRKQLTEERLELEKKRLALQHLENHISEIMTELDQLQRTADLAEADAETDEATKSAQAQAISRLEKQLLEEGEKLKQKLDKPKGDKPIFAIIPYDGPNGTHRRPIYLECEEEGVRIQPEGVLIRIADLEPPYGPGNPLDAALRTIRAHYVPVNHAVTSTAYPLLVVRPTGIRSYAMARAAMSGWDDQFGYELVGKELELVFPDGEPGLAQKIAQTLDLARQRQAALIMAMPQKYREYADRNGPLAGGGSGDGSANYASGYSGGESAAGGGWSSDGNFATSNSRGGWADGTQSGDSLADGRNSEQGASQTLGAGNNLGFGDSSNPTLDFDGARAGAGQPFQPAPNNAFASDASNLGNRSAGDSFFGSTGSAGNEMFSAESTGKNSTNGSYQPGDGSSQSSTPNTSSGSNSGGPSSSGPSSGGATNLAGSQMAVPLNAPQQSGSGTGSSSGQSGSQSANNSSNQSSADSSTQPMDGQSMPQLSVNHTFNPQRGASESATPVAARKGRGWAWSQGPPSQTSVARTIRMQCLEDRWVILADSGRSTDPNITITYEDTPQARAEKLAKVVADRVDQWGIALTGGYWKPSLEVEVAPGAEWRFSQLQQLLSGSGLEVQRSLK